MAMTHKIMTIEEVCIRADAWRSRGDKIVLTTGCYDLLHGSHIAFLRDAKALGDRLIVSLGNDATVRNLKGDSRPVYNQFHRAEMLSALECVDAVYISEEFGELDHWKIMQIVRPEMYAVGEGSCAMTAKRQLADEVDAQVVVLPPHPAYHAGAVVSTTQTVGAILRSAA